MELKYLEDKKAIIVKINEELDHHTCSKIRNKIDSEIDFRLPKKLIFDFGDVGFMDSSGIGIVMGRYKNMKSIGGEAIIANTRPTIKRIFEMSGLNKIVGFYDKVEDAMKGGVLN